MQLGCYEDHRQNVLRTSGAGGVLTSLVTSWRHYFV